MARAGSRRRLTQAELDAAINGHERFIRGLSGGQRMTLRFVDVSGLEFGNRNLTEADCTGSSFVGAHLVRSDLTRASRRARG